MFFQTSVICDPCISRDFAEENRYGGYRRRNNKCQCGPGRPNAVKPQRQAALDDRRQRESNAGQNYTIEHAIDATQTSAGSSCSPRECVRETSALSTIQMKFSSNDSIGQKISCPAPTRFNMTSGTTEIESAYENQLRGCIISPSLALFHLIVSLWSKIIADRLSRSCCGGG
jgi:hypothetical protein